MNCSEEISVHLFFILAETFEGGRWGRGWGRGVAAARASPGNCEAEKNETDPSLAIHRGNFFPQPYDFFSCFKNFFVDGFFFFFLPNPSSAYQDFQMNIHRSPHPSLFLSLCHTHSHTHPRTH